MDFQDVSHWQNNKLNRKDSARMGWSDVSISLSGPIVEDLKAHFVERWNFIYNEKYDVRKDLRYSRLQSTSTAFHEAQPISAPVGQQYEGQQPYDSNEAYGSFAQPPSQPQHESQTPAFSQQPSGQYNPSPGDYPPPPPRPQASHAYQMQDHSQPPYGQYQPAYGQSSYQSQQFYPPPPNSNRSVNDDQEESGEARGLGDFGAISRGHHHHHSQQSEEEARGLRYAMHSRFERGKYHLSGNHRYNATYGHSNETGISGQISGQIVRSCSKWSHGVPTEHSIANAYISVIENSRHFVYIENQFFITATSDRQKPVKNKIGAAIVARILRAARAGEKYKIIVVIPAIPGFAGDLKDDASRGTRAIMEFQYNSINRGGYSIMESVAREGFDPNEYISFYNLRNYDRINASASMREAEERSGIDYETAREQYDEAVELPAENTRGQHPGQSGYQQYQQATSRVDRPHGLYTGEWDSVSQCYMLGGRDIRKVPWEMGDYPEIKTFVSEELYVHSKVTHVYQ